MSRLIAPASSYCGFSVNPQQVPEPQFFEIPPLGRHYSRMWAVEDLSEEWGESARQLNQEEEQWMGENGWLCCSAIRSVVPRTLNKSNSELFPEALIKEGGLAKKSSHGPLTQRLMAVRKEAESNIAEEKN